MKAAERVRYLMRSGVSDYQVYSYSGALTRPCMYVDRIATSQLLDGLPGTTQTLDGMAAYVRRDVTNPQIRQYALEVVRDCAGHDYRCEIDALFHHCRDSITYRRDPVEGEWVQDCPRTLWVFRSGDCDDKSVALATLLGCLGHRSRFKVVGPSEGDYKHVYLEVWMRGRGWLALDPTPEHAPSGWQARGMPCATYEIWPPESDRIGPALLIGGGILLWWLMR